MKKTLLSFAAAAVAIGIYGSAAAQAPPFFNYQGIARNSAGAPLANQAIGMRLSIIEGSSSGTPMYVETRTVTTNAYGLYNVAIGAGTPVTGTLATVNFATGSKFIKVELDPAGGTAYTDLGATQLLSVPYSLHAATAASATAPTLTLTGNSLTAGGNSVTLPGGGGVSGTANNIPKFATATTLGPSQINDNGSSVTIGTAPTGAFPSRLMVAQSGTTGVDTNAAIFGYSSSVSASLKGGVFGTYDTTNNFGTGVTGLGYDGVTLQQAALASNFGQINVDAGVYGSGSVGVVGNSRTSGGVIGRSRATNTGGVIGIGNALGIFGNAGAVGNSTAPAVRYGVYGQAGGGTTTTYGLFGAALASAATSPSIGVRGDASTTGSLGVNYGVYGSAANGTQNFAGYFVGNVTVTGTLAKAGGTFKIDHPLDPENKYLYHSFVESPDMMNIYNGNATTDAQGYTTITMPSYFDALNSDYRYQLTVIGTFAQAIVKEEMQGNQFVIQTNQPAVKVSWQVTGVRKDKWAAANRVVPEAPKEAQNVGKYLHPAEWNMPASKGIDYEMLKPRPEVTADAPSKATRK